MNPHEFLPLFVFGTLRRGEPNHHLTGPFYRRARVIVSVSAEDLIAWAYVDPNK